MADNAIQKRPPLSPPGFDTLLGGRMLQENLEL
jgi:hypothetical protein